MGGLFYRAARLAFLDDWVLDGRIGKSLRDGLVMQRRPGHVRHAMIGEIITNELPHDLRWREILAGAKLLEGLLLGRVNEDGQTGGLAFHVEAMLIK